MTITERDALDFGHVAVDCPQLGRIPVYLEDGRDEQRQLDCERIGTALGKARSSGLAPAEALLDDSIAAAVARRVRWAEVPLRDGTAGEATMVTLDLRHRPFNLVVEVPHVSESPEVETAPKGLRY